MQLRRKFTSLGLSGGLVNAAQTEIYISWPIWRPGKCSSDGNLHLLAY